MGNGCVALILCGGENSRADSYRNGAPKCNLPLGDGTSIIVHLVDALKLQDIHPIILGGPSGHDDDYLPDPETPGIIPALAGAAKYLNHRRDTRILVCYGDTFLPGFSYIDACVPGTLTVADSKDGNVVFEAEGAKYDTGPRGRFWIEAGATCVSYDELIKVCYSPTWPAYLAYGHWTRVCFHSGPVLNVGDAHSYETARKWRP